MALSPVLAPPAGGLQLVGGQPAPAPAPPAPAPKAKKSRPVLKDYDPAINWASDADRDDWARKLMDKVHHSLNQLQERHDRIRSFRSQYEAVSYPKSTPWPNAANLNVPTTRSAVDTIHSDIVGAMAGTAPLFRVEAFASADAETSRHIEQLLEWQFRDQIVLPERWDALAKGSLIDGTKIAEICWRKEAKRTRRPGYVKNGDGTQKLDKDKQPIPALVEETEYTVNQPDVYDHDILDFVLYPARAVSIETAIGCGVRVWLTANDLRRGVRDGLYDKERVETLLESGANQPQTQNEARGGDDGRDGSAAIENGDPVDTEDRAYEFFRLIWQYDEDGDGVAEDCLFLIEASTCIMVRAEIYPYWHGERCFVAYTPLPREKHFFGYSIPEIIESLHEEINAIRNQRVDAGTLYLSPMLAVKRGIKFDMNRRRWRPGGVVDVDDPVNDIRPISFQNVAQTAFSEEQFAREQVERVLGTSDYAMGQSPSRSRTVGEINQVTAGGNKRIDMMIQRLHLANNVVANQVIGLDRQFLDAETEYRLTGASERIFQTFDREDLETRVRIQAQGNTVNSNKEMTLQSSETLFQMMQNEPLMQKPTRRYAIIADYLQAMGKTNVVPFIGTEDEAKKQEAQAEQAGPPPPPPPAITVKADEPASLAIMFKEGIITPEQYQQAGGSTLNYAAGEEQIKQLGAAAGKRHDAHVDTAHGIVQNLVGAAMPPPQQPGAPPPAFPPAGASASPVPPQSAPPAGGASQ